MPSTQVELFARAAIRTPRRRRLSIDAQLKEAYRAALYARERFAAGELPMGMLQEAERRLKLADKRWRAFMVSETGE